MLENLYMIFRIYPFGAPKIRAVKKEAKHYHLDWTVVTDSGARLENLVACHLLKWCHFMEDIEGRAMELILSGRRVDAEECLRIGLCERLVESGAARHAAQALAREIAEFFHAAGILSFTSSADGR